MIIPRTTLILILWFVCQQVSAATLSFHSSLPEETDSSLSDAQPCHETALEDATRTVATELMQNECCDVQCDCSISGCPSLPASASPGNVMPFGAGLIPYQLTTPPESAPTSLYRPPIFC